MCDHVGKILEWGLDDKANLIPSLYGCINCDETSTSVLETSNFETKHSHTEYVYGCFTCKIGTLTLQTGDAKSGLIDNGWTNKKWNRELKEYSDARAQGIQPKSTQTRDIRDAVAKSEKSGKAFDASKSI